MRPRVYSTEAIVLRRDDYGEADRLLTLLTPRSGKMRVMAKGARKTSSRKAGHVELFTRVSLMLARGRLFDIVTQAEAIETHRALREDLRRGSYAHYLAELSDQFAQEESEDAALYELLSTGLMWLCEARDPSLAARLFEMRLLSLAGYRPQLFRCAKTGLPLEVDAGEAERKTPFSPVESGTLAAGAALQARDVFMLSRSALMLMRALQTRDFADINRLDVPEAVAEQVESAIRRYFVFTLERALKSTRYIRQIENLEAGGSPGLTIQPHDAPISGSPP